VGGGGTVCTINQA